MLELEASQVGLCQCGCGQQTRIAKYDEVGRKAGEPRRFVQGHYVRWKRKNGAPNIGDKRRQVCWKLASRIAKEISEQRYDEIIGPAFEGAMSVYWKVSGFFPRLEEAARLAVKKYFGSQISYGRVSVDYLVEKGFEPEDESHDSDPFSDDEWSES